MKQKPRNWADVEASPGSWSKDYEKRYVLHTLSLYIEWSNCVAMTHIG